MAEVSFRTAAAADSKHGEMFMHMATQVETINVTNQDHGVIGFGVGTLDGWTFDAGKVGVGTITTAAAGAAINIADVAHGLVSGDIVAVQSANHTGNKVVTYVDDDNFTVVIAYVGDEAVNWQQGSHLIAGAAAAGDYKAQFSLSGLSAGTAKEYHWDLKHNAADVDEIAGERKHATTDMGNISSSGVISGVVEGDIIWLSVKNITDAANFTIEIANVNVVRI